MRWLNKMKETDGGLLTSLRSVMLGHLARVTERSPLMGVAKDESGSEVVAAVDFGFEISHVILLEN